MIRLLTEADARACAQLDRDVFGKEAWPPGIFTEQLRSPWIRGWGLDGDHQLDAVGIVATGIEAEILTIAVRPHRRRQGIATEILEHLLTEARDAGSAECFLEVRAKATGTHALYRSVGFTVVGRRANYYPNDDALIMKCDLSKEKRT